jgi:hypothetical protein
MKFGRVAFLRNLEAGPLVDLVLLTAVISVLGIRFWLRVSGYPQLGGDTLHIAHMLWGGLLMLAALALLIVFLDRSPRRLAAILGGIGFGTFIDEVGKFITHDNDYFYQPTVSVMYVVFVLLYLAGRVLTRQRGVSDAEYLANALREAGEIAIGDLDVRERDRALAYLAASGVRGPFVRGLERLLLEAELVAEPRPGGLARLWASLVDRYRSLAGHIWFGRALIVFFTVQFLFKLLRLTVVVRWLPPAAAPLLHVPLVAPLPADPEDFATAHWLQLGGSLLAGVFVGLGVVQVFRDRLRALRMFQRSIVVSLCVTQVFVFYRVEWLGLGELVINLLVYAALSFAIARERP